MKISDVRFLIKKKLFASVVITAALFVSAQDLSSAILFDKSIRTKYRTVFSKSEIDSFVRSYSLDVKRRVVDIIGAKAISLSRLGDCSEIFRLEDVALVEFSQLTENIFLSRYHGLWDALGESAQRVFLANPEDMKRLACMLDDMSKREKGGEYIEEIISHPNSISYLYSYPDLIQIPSKDRDVVMYILSYLDMASVDGRSQSVRVNKIIKRGWRQLLALYMANIHRYGIAPAMTYLTVPEFFRTTNDLKEDIKFNEQMWSMMHSQLGYIRTRRMRSTEWEREKREIYDVLNHEPNLSGLDYDDWVDLLEMTQKADGKMLEIMVELDRNGQLDVVERLLRRLRKNPKTPLTVVLNVLKFARDAEEFRYIVDLSCDTMYDSHDIPIPIEIMGELPRDDRFMAKLQEHKNKLIMYLARAQENGLTVVSQFEQALKSNLQDADYNESTTKKILDDWMPCGNLINVGIKAFNGYPTSNSEYFWAAVDATRIVVALCTLGGSEVSGAGTAGQEMAKTTAKVATKKVAKEIGKKGAAKIKDVAVKQAKKRAMQAAETFVTHTIQHREEYLERLVEEGLSEDLIGDFALGYGKDLGVKMLAGEKWKSTLQRDKLIKMFARIADKNLFREDVSSNTSDVYAPEHIEKTADADVAMLFGMLELRKTPDELIKVSIDINLSTVKMVMPRKYSQWMRAIDSNMDRTILMVSMEGMQ